ncbi:MAG: mycofactocin-associated electron transfer flavoprotein beta subunit [Actinomycetes bacterium]
MLVAACVKWADLRPDVDPVHGTVRSTGRSDGFSEADRAAVEVALGLADGWGAEVAVVCAGPPSAEAGLRELQAAGVGRAVRVDLAVGQPSEAVAASLAPVLTALLDADVVVCGDYSADRGSGSVPAYLAHLLGAEQALGLVGATAEGPGVVAGVRRLDGGRREDVVVEAPAVVSVEGSVATLRRASLAATLGSVVAPVEVVPGRPDPRAEPPRTEPWRPRARHVPPPEGDAALDRVVQLTGAFVERTPPRTVELPPAEAAQAVLDQLRAWGYLERPGDVG